MKYNYKVENRIITIFATFDQMLTKIMNCNICHKNKITKTKTKMLTLLSDFGFTTFYLESLRVTALKKVLK